MTEKPTPPDKPRDTRTMTFPPDIPAGIPAGRPVLIAGPTACGKSALAMCIAEARGGVVINADAIQVHANWRVLTARPTEADEARVPHRLYGHVAGDEPYSVGRWLREVTPLLSRPEQAVIVGGTGLYFTALTEGLADIPPIPPETRARAEAILSEQGLAGLIAGLDTRTRARIDCANPARVLRAFEVQQATGRGLADWHDATPPPVLAPQDCTRLLIEAPRDWLAARIAARFDAMLAAGALDEARANLALWSPALPSAKAIGAAELIAHLRGELSLDAARDRAITATRRYAKRQRTWFRARMRDWQRVSACDI